jgi:hypothetical protein
MHPVRSAPVKLTAAIARQLRLLCENLEDADRLATGLAELGASVASAVPSCTTVSVWVGAAGPDVPVTIGIRSEAGGPVLASLAVPLSASEPGDIALFQASEVGAFLLLADDLRGQLNPRLALRVDEHLHSQIDSTEAELTSSMDDLSAVNRALGILIDQGLLPDHAQAELSRRAQRDGTDLPAAGRILLDSIGGPANPVRD